MVFLCKFGQNPLIGSGNSADKAHLCGDLENKVKVTSLIKSSNYPNITMYEVWPESAICSKFENFKVLV